METTYESCSFGSDFTANDYNFSRKINKYIKVKKKRNPDRGKEAGRKIFTNSNQTKPQHRETK